MSEHALSTVDFHGTTIFAIHRDGNPFVAITPICNDLGLAPQKQRDRILRDPILCEGGTTMVTPSAGGMQETFVLRLDLVHGWLFTIDEARVKEASRARVLLYKRECYRVLHRHFTGDAEPAHPPEIVPGDRGFPHWPLDEMRTKKSITDMYRMIYGIKAAQWINPQMGFPVPPAGLIEIGGPRTMFPDDYDVEEREVARFDRPAGDVH